MLTDVNAYYLTSMTYLFQPFLATDPIYRIKIKRCKSTISSVVFGSFKFISKPFLSCESEHTICIDRFKGCNEATIPV